MNDPPPSDPDVFRTTRWTRVLEAKGDSETSKAALSELCEIYYGPVHAFVRHDVRDPSGDCARDLTHEFFAGLLAKPGLDSLERGRGRFRSYLLGAVKHFLSDVRRKKQAARRGGGRDPISIDAGKPSATGTHFRENVDAAEPAASDAVYDREWALAVLARALEQLAEEHRAAEKFSHFEMLKPWLSGDAPASTQAEAGAILGLSEGAVKVAIHRLRKRFRGLIHSEIAQTVDDEAEVSAELNYLIEALGR